MYDVHGRIEGYVRPSTEISRGIVPPLNVPTPPPMSETLYMRTSEGSFIPVPNQPCPPPNNHLPPETKVLGPNPQSIGQGPWDGWPDGRFHRDFTLDEYKQADNLKIHWANRAIGGDRTGDEHALTWEKGKKATRRCLGVITCNNDNCIVVIRPKTTPKAIHEQLNQPCVCTAKVHLQRCEVRSFSYKWSNGVHFYNDGVHAHHRPGRVLHLLNDERERFESLVKAHPNTGPLGLIVGVPGLTGPGESVADISDVFLNADRVSKERQKIKHSTDSGGDSFIAAFAKFTEEYPGFVIYSTLGKVTVISVQTKFMQSTLFKESQLDGPVNGTVNDAAHGWWKERNSLLMITSAHWESLGRCCLK
ncbi:hypothetical protein M413DRAFT_12871 [Hebeloma cylindrosporum]|uniref:GCM domain-containing protein n=1 Tax=Hebeloma cylindrosporum TaxID=76867 RepID=A0A0C3C2D6_HEBCY|nr:hypothetical protein M413DRAFT_12871 [Hebeloma cylindrosporum h7]